MHTKEQMQQHNVGTHAKRIRQTNLWSETEVCSSRLIQIFCDVALKDVNKLNVQLNGSEKEHAGKYSLNALYAQ